MGSISPDLPYGHLSSYSRWTPKSELALGTVGSFCSAVTGLEQVASKWGKGTLVGETQGWKVLAKSGSCDMSDVPGKAGSWF